jgi:hypothetical protein
MVLLIDEYERTDGFYDNLILLYNGKTIAESFKNTLQGKSLKHYPNDTITIETNVLVL